MCHEAGDNPHICSTLTKNPLRDVYLADDPSKFLLEHRRNNYEIWTSPHWDLHLPLRPKCCSSSKHRLM
jgi:hypothetical protein